MFGILAHSLFVENKTILLQICEYGIDLYRLKSDDPVSAAVLCQQADLVGDRILRAFDLNLFAVLVDLAAGFLPHTENGFHHFRTSRTNQACKTKDFTLVKFK